AGGHGRDARGGRGGLRRRPGGVGRGRRPRAERDARLLEPARGDPGGPAGRLVPHRGRRLRGRRRLPLSGRPREGHGQHGRLQDLAARGGGGTLPPSRGRRVRGGGSPGCRQGRAGPGVRRPPARRRAHRGRAGRLLPPASRGLQGAAGVGVRGRAAEERDGEDPQARPARTPATAGARRRGGAVKTAISRYTVEWAHCDAAGIVFYPYFYMWFDQGTERLFKANRLSYPELRRDFGVVGMPLLETGARYENACRLGDELELHSWVDEWAGRTFLVRHRVQHADGRAALTGFERRAWVVPDPDSPRGLRAVRVPDEAMARFVD